jgi:hypothetical protein
VLTRVKTTMAGSGEPILRKVKTQIKVSTLWPLPSVRPNIRRRREAVVAEYDSLHFGLLAALVHGADEQRRGRDGHLRQGPRCTYAAPSLFAPAISSHH